MKNRTIKTVSKLSSDIKSIAEGTEEATKAPSIVANELTPKRVSIKAEKMRVAS